MLGDANDVALNNPDADKPEISLRSKPPPRPKRPPKPKRPPRPKLPPKPKPQGTQ